MACTSKKRFNSFIKELSEKDKLNLSKNDIILIKEKIEGNFLPHLHETLFPINYKYDPEELGLFDIYGKNVSKQFINGKISTFKNALKKLRDGEKLNSNQSKVYKEISKWLDQNINLKTKSEELKKGSSSNTSKIIPETKLIQQTLTGKNIRDTFMSVLMGVDIKSGKKILATPDFNNHLENLFDKMENVMNTLGNQTELMVGLTEQELTRGLYDPGIDNKTLKDKDSVSVLFNPNDSTATASEILLHELLHSFFKRAVNAKPKLRTAFKLLRSEVKRNINAGIFLEQAIKEERTQLTEDEKQSIKEKWDYIMSDDADIEEFMAYVMSNSFLYNAVKDIHVKPNIESNIIKIFKNLKEMKDLDGVGNKIGRLLNFVLDLITLLPVSLYNAVKHRLSGESNTVGKTGLQIINESIADIEKFRLKAEHLNDPDNFSKTMKEYAERLENPILAGSLETTASFVKFLEDNKIKVTAPIKKLTSKLFELRDEAYDKIKPSNNENTKAIIDILKKVSIVKNALESRFYKSFMFQNFSSTEWKDIKRTHRIFKSGLDAVLKNVLGGIKELANNSTIGKPEFSYHSYIFSNKILKFGIHKYIDNINFETLNTKEQLNALADEIKAKLLEQGVTPKQLDHMDALAKFLNDGMVHIDSQQINVQNILNNYFEPAYKNPSRKANQKTLELAEKYIAVKSTSQMSDIDIDILNEIYTTKELFDDVNQIHELYKKEYNSIKFDGKITDYNNLPYGYIAYNLNKSKYQISLVHKNELDDFKASTNTSKVLEKFSLMGEEFYKVKHINNTSAYEDGIIGSISLNQQGKKIRSLFESIFREKIKKKLPEVQGKNMEVFVQEAMNSVLEKNSAVFKSDKLGIMPVYNSKGTVTDWIIPYSQKDYEELEVNKDMLDIVPHTITRLVSYKKTIEKNEYVVDLLNKMYKSGEYDDYDFIEISNIKNKDMFNKLNSSLQKYIIENYDGVLHVPDIVLELIIGARESSLANLRKKHILPYSDNDNYAIESYKLRRWIKLGEKIWSEILSNNKVATILFNPQISIGNMISNMMLMWTHGVPPNKFFAEFYNKWYLLDEYEKLSRKKVSLEIQKRAGMNVDMQLNRIKDQLNRHAFKDLVDDGQFAALVDDLDNDPDGVIAEFYHDFVEKDENDRNYWNKVMIEAYNRKANDQFYKDYDIEDIVDDVISDFKDEGPKIVIAKELEEIRRKIYGSKGTAAHKFATKFTMYADTIARQMLYEKMKNDTIKEKGSFTKSDKDNILDFVDEQFINYGYNISGSQMWLEKVFGVQFLKYLFQHHKAYLKVIKANPSGVAGQQIAQHATGINIPDPLDTLMDRGLIDNLEVRWRGNDPVGQLEDLISENITMPMSLFDMDTYFKVYH